MKRPALLLFLCTATHAAPTPPIPMAPSFSVRFNETYSGYPAPPSTGAWFYEWDRRRWRAEHDAPQTNNFCGCASNTTIGSCALIFTPEARGGLYIDFPNSPSLCCHLCDADDGCSILLPGWLSASPNLTYAGEDQQGCGSWCVPGGEAVADCMSYPLGGGRVPCQYSETFNFSGAVIGHNLTFATNSYTEGPQSDALFALRPECAKDCPRLFPSQCG